MEEKFCAKIKKESKSEERKLCVNNGTRFLSLFFFFFVCVCVCVFGRERERNRVGVTKMHSGKVYLLRKITLKQRD